MINRTVATWVALAISVGAARASEARRPATVREAMEARWIGSWVVTTADTYSECVGIYTDNLVSGGRVSSRGRHRLAAGTPARVDSLDLNGAGVDLRLTLSEILLVSRHSGARTLRDGPAARSS